MKQKLFSNIIFLVFANLLIKPLWIFGIDLQVQNTVGTASYGVYFAVFNFTFLLHIILDMGINQYHNRDIAQFPENLKRQFGKFLVLKGFFSIAYIVTTMGLALVLGFDDVWHLLGLLMLNQILISIILFVRSSCTAMQWYKWDAFFSVFDRVLAIVFCLLLLQKSDFDILDFVFVQLVALTLSAFFALLVVVFKGKVLFPILRKEDVVLLLKKTAPYALAVLLMALYTRVDAVMIKQLLPQGGEYQAGIYAAGYRILDAVNMIPFLFASLLIPTFARLLKRGDDFVSTLRMGFHALMGGAIGLSILAFFYGESAMFFMYKQADESWLYSFQILLFSFNAVCIIYVFGGFLTAAGKVNIINKMAVICIVGNIALNWLLIPLKGAAGAAIATIITQGAMALVQMIYVFIHWKINVEIKNVIKFLVYTTILWLVAYGLSFIPFSWQIKSLGIVLIAVFLALVLRIIDLKQILSLKK